MYRTRRRRAGRERRPACRRPDSPLGDRATGCSARSRQRWGPTATQGATRRHRAGSSAFPGTARINRATDRTAPRLHATPAATQGEWPEQLTVEWQEAPQGQSLRGSRVVLTRRRGSRRHVSCNGRVGLQVTPREPSQAAAGEALGSFHAHPALRRKWSACTPDLNRCVDRSSRCRALDRP